MAGTRLSKSSGDLPCDLGKPQERSLMALGQEDQNDGAFRLVRCAGHFLFILAPVHTSAFPCSGGHDGRESPCRNENGSAKALLSHISGLNDGGSLHSNR